MADKFYIYLYYDPRDNIPIYVGKGKGKRAYDHLISANNSGLSEAIAECRALGLEPVVNIEEYFKTDREACAREVELISHYGRRIMGDGSLFNIMPGGEGLDEETAQRIWSDPELREKHAEGIRRRDSDPEYRVRHAKAARERLVPLNVDPKFRKKQAQAAREVMERLRTSPEFCNKLAEGHRRYWERKRQENNDA